MKLLRPWHIVFIISWSVYPKKKIIIILASVITWYLKTGNLCGYLDFTSVTENRCKVVIFLNHSL